jgi:hypothetical protein
MSKLIKLPERSWLRANNLSHVIPFQATLAQPFKMASPDFMLSHPRLQKKLIDGSVISESYAKFVADPFARGTVYACTSDPNDSIALYFAAHLLCMSAHYSKKRLGRPLNARWLSLHKPSEINKVLSAETTSASDITVLSGLTETSSADRVELARDLLLSEQDKRIPVILTAAGPDPVTLMSAYLRMRFTHMFFQSTKLAKRTEEV